MTDSAALPGNTFAVSLFTSLELFSPHRRHSHSVPFGSLTGNMLERIRCFFNASDLFFSPLPSRLTPKDTILAQILLHTLHSYPPRFVSQLLCVRLLRSLKLNFRFLPGSGFLPLIFASSSTARSPSKQVSYDASPPCLFIYRRFHHFSLLLPHRSGRLSSRRMFATQLYNRSADKQDETTRRTSLPPPPALLNSTLVLK